MPEFADEYQQQLSMETRAMPMAPAHEERSATPAKSGGSQPNDAVLTKWIDGYDACAADNPSLVCDQKREPVPPPFNVQVPGMHCVPPPRATNWAAAPSLVTCPTEMMSGEPNYKAAYESENLEPYKAAFGDSWSHVRTSHNGLVTMHRALKDNEKEIIPILQVGASRPVGAGVQGIDAARSFVGGKLRPSLTKIDSSKFSPDFRAQLYKARDRTKTTELDVDSKRALVSNANLSLVQQGNAYEKACNELSIVSSDTAIENLQLDKDQVKRDVEDFKARSKAAMESVKLVTSIINVLTDPKKIFENVIGAVNQAATAGGAIDEASYSVDANKRLAKLDGQIRGLKNFKGILQLSSAGKAVHSELLEMQRKMNEAANAVRSVEASNLAHRDAYRDMGALIEKAGALSGLSPKDRKAVAGAVEAVPKIETIQQQLQGMDEALQLPPYDEASGIGATMASNLGAFTHAVSVVKGNKEYIAELKVLWEARRTSVLAVVDKAASGTGDE